MNGWLGGGESLGVRCRGVNLCGVFFLGGVDFCLLHRCKFFGCFFCFFRARFFHCRPKGLEKSAPRKWLFSVCQVVLKFQ